jgi:hypothetical protein
MTPARFVVSAARLSPPPPAPLTPLAVPPTPPVGSPTPLAVPPQLTARDEQRGPATPARTFAQISPLRIAAWQSAIAVGLTGAGQNTATAIAAGATGLSLLALGALRIHGEWLSTLATTALTFALRQRSFPGDHLPLPPGTTICPDGILTSPWGLTACVRPEEAPHPVPGHTPIDGPAAPESSAHAGERTFVLGDGGEAGERTVVLGGGGRAEVCLTAVSHREAGLGDGGAGVGAFAGRWVAVGARGGGGPATDEELRRVLDNAVRRVAPEGGWLGAAELRETLAMVSKGGPSRESWRCWHSGPFDQVTLGFWTASAAGVECLLREGGDAAVTVAVGPGGGGVLRVAATSPGVAERAVRRIVAAGARSGTRLRRLDGRHGPSVLATLPIGGILR